MAANNQAVSPQFKVDILQGAASLAAGGHTLKAALYFQNSGIGVGTGSYTATGEVGGTNYTAGGIVVPNATGVLVNGATIYWTPSNSLVWPNLTISSPFDCVLIYDLTDGSHAIAAFTFPAQTVSQSTFTITMPANVSTSALVQVN